MRHIAIAAALAATFAAMPAGADVKAGVDAWSRGDFKAAVEQWRAPALAGDPDAQFNLGQAYKLGRGVPVDPALAQSWFRKAALQGHYQAEDNLGLSLFQDGRRAEALPWLEKSVARDEKRAELVLGTMLFNGDGVPKDWTRAYALVTRSQQQGLTQAGPTLAQMDQYVPAEQRQRGIALAQQYERTAKQAAPLPMRPTVDPSAPPAQYGVRSPSPPSPPAAGAPAVATATPRPAPLPAGSTATRTGGAGNARNTPGEPKAAASNDRARPRTVATAPRAAATPAPARGGAWRIQLGAFRDEGNARALWSRVGARVGGSPAYVKAGGFTRLQAVGFANRAEAQRACARAGGGCVPVAP